MFPETSLEWNSIAPPTRRETVWIKRIRPYRLSNTFRTRSRSLVNLQKSYGLECQVSVYDFRRCIQRYRDRDCRKMATYDENFKLFLWASSKYASSFANYGRFMTPLGRTEFLCWRLRKLSVWPITIHMGVPCEEMAAHLYMMMYQLLGRTRTTYDVDSYQKFFCIWVHI